MTSILARILTSGAGVNKTLMGTLPMTGMVVNVVRGQQERRQSLHEYRSDEDKCHALIRGIDYLRDPRLFKGMAFTLKERQLLGIHGLLPPCFKTQEEQVATVINNVDRYDDPLNAYIYLMTLQDRNERLFYRVLSENVRKLMPIVYTPTVGIACQKYGLLYRRPRGIFISIHDKGHVLDILNNWPEPDVKAIVITDGERILGLGDLGACGMGIPVGKLALYTALAGIKPHHCLPVCLDVGTNNEALLKDPFYIGLKQKRVRGQEYDDIIEEFMQAVVMKYGQNCIVQFEDFGNQNAFRLLARYRKTHCTFNDDIQGTAAVALAGLLASGQVTGKKLSDNTIFFLGAGEAALGIANLLVQAMILEGTSSDDAHSKIWLSDSSGLVVKTRTNGMIPEKVGFAKDYAQLTNVEKMMEEIKPSMIVGVAAATGAFNENVLRLMAKNNERPVIFALSNPTDKAECTSKQAYEFTDGKCVFASGSPFPPVVYKDKTYRPGQGNNAYIFPGIALAVIACGMYHIPRKVFVIAAKTLASMVQQSDLDVGRVYPPLEDIQNVSVKIAVSVVTYAYTKGLAGVHPEPADKEAFVRSCMYDSHYPSSLLPTYQWPVERGDR